MVPRLFSNIFQRNNFANLISDKLSPTTESFDLNVTLTRHDGQGLTHRLRAVERDQILFLILFSGTESETNNQNGTNFTKKYSDEGIEMPPYASTG